MNIDSPTRTQPDVVPDGRAAHPRRSFGTQKRMRHATTKMDVSCVSIRGRADSTAEALTAAQLAATAEVTMQPHWRLAGNAVTPPAAHDLIDVVVEALTGEPVRRAA